MSASRSTNSIEKVGPNSEPLITRMTGAAYGLERLPQLDSCPARNGQIYCDGFSRFSGSGIALVRSAS
jgi:hypothetical protein